MSGVESSQYSYSPDERPTFPGSPAVPAQSASRRTGAGVIGAVLAICATFGNALVNVNVASIGGALGLYVAEASWLPAIYVAMNASANLSLVKARAQWGIPWVTHTLLWIYAGVGAIQLMFPGFAAAIAVRAVCGMTAAALTTLSIYYLLQAFPGKFRPLSLVVGMGLTQLGTPLARLVPVEMLALDHGQSLALIEIALPLSVLALITAFPLPPSERSTAFERTDFVTIALLVPAYVLVCGVLSLGRVYWWTDAPWIGYALVCAVPLFVAVLLIERRRDRPLLQLRWLRTRDILRFAAVALFVRLALAEQTYAAVGLLTSGGLSNDELRTLFSIVAVAMFFGVVCAALTLSERRLPYQVAVAALMIASAAWLDSNATNLTRPEQLYFSQALLGFGTTLFIGPALVYGFIRMFSRGADHLVSFIVLFSTTQNVGGLAGSALLGSYQIEAARHHALALSERVLTTDPAVAGRILGGAASLSGVIVDPALRAGQGAGLLSRAMAREASVLGFDDVFRWLCAAGLFIAAYVLVIALYKEWRRHVTHGVVA
ncbi:MFS transporter [Steroidobacter flavus]|uniref:MFS transporter n=1 Tax=Steroidobacter flavus TaxID=1842136 RepID=A0ABV8T4Y5_9GAMM